MLGFMLPSSRGIPGVARGLVVVAAVVLPMACGAPAGPPSDVAEPVAIGAPSPAEPKLVEQASSVRRPGPIDLVEGDGELLLHIDLASLRQSVLYPAVRALFTQEERLLRKVRDRCGFQAFDVVDEVAVSLHNLDQDGPLIAAQLNIAEGRAMDCVRQVWPEGKAGKLGELDAHQLRESRRTAVVVATDGMIFLGMPTEIRRALGRRKAQGCAPINLRAALPMRRDTPFAVVLESGSEEVAWLTAKAIMQGQQLRLSGEVRFRDQSWRKAGEAAERAQGDLFEARDELREFVQKGLAPNHPLLAQLDTLDVKREGAQLSATLSLAPDPSMGPALDKLMAQAERNTLTVEAKNTIGAIARGAAAAYERETMAGPGAGAPAHQLCRSAIDVPVKVPRGRSYQPLVTAGQDYDTGNATTGWNCLKFSLSQPHRYQYSYRQGGRYKGPARGGPNPGPRGFEASAEGDLDGDGHTSLFTLTGTVDPVTGHLRIASPVFSADELE